MRYGVCGCCCWMFARLCGKVWAEGEAAGRMGTYQIADRAEVEWFGEKTFFHVTFPHSNNNDGEDSRSFSDVQMNLAEIE